jgi:hypothetical protein
MLRTLATAAASLAIGATGTHYATTGQLAALQRQLTWENHQVTQLQLDYGTEHQYVNLYLAHKIECVRQVVLAIAGQPVADDGACAIVAAYESGPTKTRGH